MKKWIVCMVIGLLPLLGAAGVFRGDGKPGEITCGSETMRPGDVCEETQRGVPVDTETYEEKLQEAKEAANDFTPTRRWVSFGIGMALECLGIVGMVVTRRRRATRPTTTADIALGQRPHPGSGYPPGFPSQQPGQPMAQYNQPPQQHPQWSQQQQQPFGPNR
jgi:hypothetical protein